MPNPSIASTGFLHFDSSQQDESLPRGRKDYGFMKVRNLDTPYPKQYKEVDSTILKERLQMLAKDNAENPQAFKRRTFASVLLRKSEAFNEINIEIKAQRLIKGEYLLIKNGRDMRRTLHGPGPMFPGVVKVYPKASAPSEWKVHGGKLKYIEETELADIVVKDY